MITDQTGALSFMGIANANVAKTVIDDINAKGVGDPFSKELLDRYDRLYPGSAKFTGGSACSGLYRV